MKLIVLLPFGCHLELTRKTILHTRRYLCFVLLLPLFMYLCGCPYESDFPLSRSNETDIDKKLLGKWKLQTEKGEQSGTLTIYQFNEHEYLILLLGEGEKDVALVRAFGTTINGHKFLNIQDINSLGGTKGKWYFVNYSISDDKLMYKYVKDILFENKNINCSKELRSFVKNNLQKKSLYNEYDKKIFDRFNE